MNPRFPVLSGGDRNLGPGPRSPWFWMQLFCGLFPFSPILAGLSFGVLLVQILRQRAVVMAQRPLNRALAALSGWLIFTAVVADDRGNALLGLTNFLPFFLFFAVVRELRMTVAQVHRLTWILAIAAVPVIAIGLGQIYGGWAGHVRLLGGTLDWVIEAGGTPPGRMASIFAYANVLASYLVVTFTLTLGLWVDAWTTLRRGHFQATASASWPRSPQSFTRLPWPSFDWTAPIVWQIGLLTLTVAAHLVAILLTDSRSAWGITAIVGLAFAIYCRWYGVILVGLGMIASVFWAAFGPFGQSALRAIVPTFLWARLTDQNFPDRPLASLRMTQWQFAAAMTQERPWTGWGLRSFSRLYEATMDYWLGHPHNLFLMLAAETGIPATLGLMAIVAIVLYRGIRQWRVCDRQSDPMTALMLFTYGMAFGACLLFHSFDVPLFDARINGLGWLLLAAITALEGAPNPGAPKRSIGH